MRSSVVQIIEHVSFALYQGEPGQLRAHVNHRHPHEQKQDRPDVVLFGEEAHALAKKAEAAEDEEGREPLEEVFPHGCTALSLRRGATSRLAALASTSRKPRASIRSLMVAPRSHCGAARQVGSLHSPPRRESPAPSFARSSAPPRDRRQGRQRHRYREVEPGARPAALALLLGG